FSMRALLISEKSECGDILFALNGHYEEFASSIYAVLKAFPERKIFVRPHPSERNLFLRTSIARISGIHIDTNTDIYDTFSHVSIVIGEVSTALLEAVALGKYVFSWRSPISNSAMQDLPIAQFTSFDELIALLRGKHQEILTKEQREALFITDWKSQYIDFVTSL
ncbi:MAG: hypothetical protein FWG97_02000, partial [Deltaproteobacteria bacterium]|nr:hypothetical protein [Deltaproteobacteria bacterium]